MKLEAEGRRSVEDPDGGEIQLALGALALPDRTSLTLSRGRMSYVQVAITPSGLRLEWREGGETKPEQSTRRNLTSDEALRMLAAYRQGDDAWRRELDWQPIGTPGARDGWDRLSQVCAWVGLAMMLVLAVSTRRLGQDTVFGLEPFQFFSLAYLVFLPSPIIDLRRFPTMRPLSKMRTVGALFVGLLVAAYWALGAR